MKPNSNDVGWTEEQRLAALYRYEILDTPAEQAYDDFVKLARSICNTSIAMITLVDADRQWFKAESGLRLPQTGLNISICAHAIRQREIFTVPDTALDPRFADSPLTRPPTSMRFYAGAVLETPEGLPLGTLCVLDSAPRPGGLTADQSEMLKALARQVMTQMELRHALTAKMRAEAALSAASQTNADILASIDDPFFAFDADFNVVFGNAEFARMLGHAGQNLLGRSYFDLTAHLADYHLSDGMTLMRRVMEDRISTRREITSRGHGYSWIDIAVYPTSNGGIAVYVRNIAERKRLEAELAAALRRSGEQVAEKELLMLETHHRVKNSLQMVQSLLTLQSRNIADPETARKVVESAARVRIFGALHETLYRVADGTHVDMAAYLAIIVTDLNSGMGATLVARPVVLDAETLRWPSADVAIVGLVVTELVTNALKYGLGVVRIKLRAPLDHGGDAILTVTDEGVSLPADFDPAKTTGMGMRLVSRLLRDRGGRLVVDRTCATTSFQVTLDAQSAATFGT